MSKIQLGSVSTATMRKEDLIPVFVNELLAIDPNNVTATDVWAKYSEYEEDDETYWRSEESDYDLDDLFEEFNHVCDVPYVYFGAHPGDGADYGYWIDFDAVEDDIEYDELLCVTSEEEIPADYVGLVAFKSKGNVVALYNSKNGNFESMIWGV